jgi:DNA-binding MarR family transcriptional regulator
LSGRSLADKFIVVNSSDAERFEAAYRRLWAALHRREEPAAGGLSHHARELLQHVPAEGGVTLERLRGHLGLPKSTASVLVKRLAEHGLVTRGRAPGDERRLAIVLTERGRRAVADDTVLEPARLAAALAALPEPARRALLAGIEQLAGASELAAGSKRADR